MIGKNIKYYRQMRNLSQEKLAQEIGVQKMTISNYEADKRSPDYNTVRKLSEALGVPIGRLMVNSDNQLSIQHGSFRKQSGMQKKEQDFILETADRYFARLFEVVSIVGDAAIPDTPAISRFQPENSETGGQHLREYLSLPLSGPVGNITDILENKGFLLCPISHENRHFSGNSGSVNGRPYIIINTEMPVERQRFTLIHELAHLLFCFGSEQNEEHMVDEITGAFLLPEADILRELGPKRTNICGDLRRIQREYGISMAAIAFRAKQAGIINQHGFETTMKWLSKNGLRINEKSELPAEKSSLFEQLTSRAVAEGEIGISKAAEILELPLLDARKICYGEL